MTTKEMIKTEIDHIDDQYIDELHKLIQRFIAEKARSKDKAKPKELMAGLRKIKIQGPADFSENLDDYLNGEKRVE